MDKRSIYLDDYTDDIQPCDPTLEGYAAFLASGGNDDWPNVDIPEDGTIFAGSALQWKPDIIATRKDGKWSLSREPSDDEFVAVRFGPGLGWWPDGIIYPETGLIDGKYVAIETMAESVLRWLSENDETCNDTEYVAVAEYQEGLSFRYRSDPPRLTEITKQ